MSSSSSASSSGSSRSPSPPPQPKKRKREPVKVTPKKEEEEDKDLSSDSDSDSDARSDAGSEAESDSDDVPALSHAEKRRQKKKEKLAARAAKGEVSALAKTAKGSATTAAAGPGAGKRQNSVWVGNLSFKTTADALKAFFAEAGEVTRVNMPMKASKGPLDKGENRGFAYVDFATAEAKTAAIAMSEQNLVGRRLLIKDGNDFTGRPAVAADAAAGGDDPTKNITGHTKTAQKILRAQKQPPAPTLFLGNLGFDTTEQSIKELFEAHRAIKKRGKAADADGEDSIKEEKETTPSTKDVWIRKVRMGTFEDSGTCKGFAFVDFTTIEHATAALINPKNYLLNGRKLVVEYASADAVRRGAPRGARKEDGALPTRRNDALPRRPFKQDRPPRDYSDSTGRPAEPAAAPEDDNGEADNRPAKRQHVIKQERPSTNASGRVKGPRVRPKPGAALALAKRESAAILPSVGKKITF